jgi:Transposase IS66 family
VRWRARDAHSVGTMDAAALLAEADRLGAQLDKLVAGATRYPAQPAAAQPLAVERAYLFTFLRLPGVQATNWRAEQAIRPAVLTRKSWGGNRSWPTSPSPDADEHPLSQYVLPTARSCCAHADIRGVGNVRHG